MTDQKQYRYLGYMIAIASLVVVGAVALHSVEEIHYLKTFYPHSFTVSEALDAALVEVIKVGLIAVPFLLTWKFWRELR